MKTSGDLVIGRSGDRKNALTAETRRRGEHLQNPTTEARRHGEGSGDRRIGKSGDREGGFTAETRRRGEHLHNPTTEAPRHGEGSGDLVIARDRVIKIIQTIKATLREIFDESAYDRFLLRTHGSRSVASYRDFIRERDAAMLTKPRCC